MADRLSTKIWEKKFFEAFRRTANVTQSALAAGVDRYTIYKRKKNNAGFRARLEDAEQEALEMIESVLTIEAQQGDVRTGQWMLARRWPDRYADPIQRAQVATTGSQPQEVILKFTDGTPIPPLPFDNKKT